MANNLFQVWIETSNHTFLSKIINLLSPNSSPRNLGMK